MKNEAEKQDPSVGWSKASGAIRATILTLRHIGWEPLRPNMWYNADRSQCVDVDTTDCKGKEVRESALKHMVEITWAKAQHHFLGDGLQKGCPSVFTEPNLNNICKRGSRFRVGTNFIE